MLLVMKIIEINWKMWLFRYKNKTVAIKIVKRGESPEEIAKRESRFAREVSMLSRVQHKNLVKVSASYLLPNLRFILLHKNFDSVFFFCSSLVLAKNQSWL